MTADLEEDRACGDDKEAAQKGLRGQTEKEFKESTLCRNATTSYKALSGIRWVTLGMGFQKVFQFLAVVVLARLLTPADFGLIAVATLTLGAVNRIKQLGLHSAFIQRQGEVQEAANACFAMTGVISVAIYVAILALSPVIGEYFASPRIIPVLKVLGLSLLIDAASGIQSIWAIRNMQFRKHSMIGSIEMMVTAIVSVAMAFLGFGVWALVWGSLAGPFAGAILWWTVDPWRPSRAFSVRVIREMFNFGIKLSLAGTFDGLAETAIRAIVGRLFGTMSLGFFDFALRLVQLPFRQVIDLTQRVALPAYCRELDDLALVGRWHMLVTRYSCLVMGCVSAPFVVLADPLIPLVFGEQWRPAVPLVRILAPMMFLMPLLYAWTVHSATANLNVLVVFMGARLTLTFLAVGWGAQFGIIPAAAALLAVSALLSAAHLVLVSNRLRLTGRQVFGAVAMPLAVCLTSAFAMAGVRILTAEILITNAWVVCSASLSAGFCVAAGTVLLLHPETFRELRRVLPEAWIA